MGLCEILGFDAMSLANEGTFVLTVKKEDADKTMKILKGFNSNASTIGNVTDKHLKKVILKSS